MPVSDGPPQRLDADHFERMLDDARGGSAQALGRLFDGCRQYLLLVANQELRAELQPKIGGSDLVQDTFVEAQRDFSAFRGRTQADLLAWMRQILLNNLRDARKHFAAAARRESSRALAEYGSPEAASGKAVQEGETPSWLAELREERELLERALDRLAPDHRQVLTLRNLELKSFVEIAGTMQRTPDAVRKLWGRAIAALAEEMRERTG
jgi:RNA polymerase sigma-70 factor (ECF subfamily)